MADKANVSAESSKSIWLPVPNIAGEPLADSRPADLVVVGGGIAGLSVAYQAARDGREVVILDRGALGSGMTARTTAHLTCTLDDFYHEFIALRGEDEARLLYQSQAAAIDRIEQIVRSEVIDCDFARCDGYLFLGEGDDPTLLEKELEA
jgi:glycine/D-amino acid oxidase-like deaminating enzyme